MSRFKPTKKELERAAAFWSSGGKTDKEHVHALGSQFGDECCWMETGWDVDEKWGLEDWQDTADTSASAALSDAEGLCRESHNNKKADELLEAAKDWQNGRYSSSPGIYCIFMRVDTNRSLPFQSVGRLDPWASCALSEVEFFLGVEIE